MAARTVQLVSSVELNEDLNDCQVLGKRVSQSLCSPATKIQSLAADCSPGEQVSVHMLLDDQSDDGYATSQACSSPGSIWSSVSSPIPMDEDTIFSIASLSDEMSNDSLFGGKPTTKRSADHQEEKPAKYAKCNTSPVSILPTVTNDNISFGSFSAALKHSQLLLHLAGTSVENKTITVQKSSSCPPDQSMSKSNSRLGSQSCGTVPKVTKNVCKSRSLVRSYPASHNGVELKIVDQPERHHRARYLVEGSRGCVKNEAKVGFPTVQLHGWKKAAELEVFIITDQGNIRPHGYYQACKVTGQNATPCSEIEIEGSRVIKIPWEPCEKDDIMELCVDCVGILKLRNADVEHNGGHYRSKKKSTTVRIAFRVNLKGSKGLATLQTISTPVCCTQPLGHPEVLKKSLTGCPASGGKDLFIVGKNFISKTCEVKLIELSGAGTVVWTGKCEIDKTLFHNTHIVCSIPPYKEREIQRPVEVYLVVTCGGGKSSELMAHPITYTPLPEYMKKPTPKPLPDLSNAAVLQLLASRLSCTKDKPAILKHEQIPCFVSGQLVNLEINPPQELQHISVTQQQPATPLSFEDLMKTAAGLMVKPAEDVPVQLLSSIMDLSTSDPSVALLSTAPVQLQQHTLDATLLQASTPSSSFSSSILSTGSIPIQLAEPILFNSSLGNTRELLLPSPLLSNNPGVSIGGLLTPNLTVNNYTASLISDVVPPENIALPEFTTAGKGPTGLGIDDVTDLLKSLQQKPTSFV